MIATEERVATLVAENNRLRRMLDRRNATVDLLSDRNAELEEALLRAQLHVPAQPDRLSHERKAALCECIHVLAVELGAGRRA